ncbi:hypothetical protein LCGC14_1722750 [marine sediment metagenome]|uniref:Uncharacterized protein n=1 Tax=marine sediment metagenome TaxID=412755 RepID=A0A0F9HZM6_9ZZZZ
MDQGKGREGKGRYLMGTRLCCEADVRFDLYQCTGLDKAVKAFASGLRATWILDLLAKCRVWARMADRPLPTCPGLDKSTWLETLDELVRRRLGDRHCLECNEFFDSKKVVKCMVGLGRSETHIGPATRPIDAFVCPHCGSTLSEEIG